MHDILNRIEKIVNICETVVAEGASPNVDVVKIIRREFEKIKDSVNKDGKIPVLNKKRELWACRTIVDSANLDCDDDLFQKVFAFEKMCRKLPNAKIVVLF